MKTFLKLEPTADGYTIVDLSPNAALTHAEAQLRTPEGAYTTFRTYDKYFVLNLAQHFDRLEETSRLTCKPVHLNRAAIQKTIVDVLNDVPTAEARVRLSVDLSINPGELYLSTEEFSPIAKETYEKGVDTATTQIRRANPQAKLNRFLSQADALRRSEKKDVEEYLMLNENREILEGLSSNFFAIIDREIFTADEGVLSGTTRKFIIDVAHEAGIPVHYRPVSIFELRKIQEAFISSTSRSILPVRKIDKQVIGEGSVGPVTKQLMELFDTNLKKGLSDLRQPL